MDLTTDIIHKYQVRLEESWYVETDQEAKAEKWRYYELFGDRGIIFPYGKGQLAVTFNTKNTSNKFVKRKDWKILQNGDYETTCLFPKDDFYLVAKAIQAKRKRSASANQLQNLKNPRQKGSFSSSEASS